MIIICSIILSLFISLAYANSYEQSKNGLLESVTKSDSNSEASVESNNDLENELPIFGDLTKTTLEPSEQQVNTRLEGMNHELILLRVQAFELGNIELAKEIEGIENELVIEKNTLLQSLKKTSKRNAFFTNETLLESDRFQDLEDKYVQNIYQYKGVLRTSLVKSEESTSVGKVGDGQIIPAGAKATISLKTSSIRDKVLVEVIDSGGNKVVTQSTYEPTDYQSYTWSTSPTTLSDTYTIVLTYPQTSEVEDTFTVYVSPVPSPVEIKEDIPVEAKFSNGEYQVYEFTPTESKAYRISMEEYDGADLANDAWLGLYDDASLTNIIQNNSDKSSTTAEIISDFTAGTPYYIALKSDGNNDIDTRMVINASIVYPTEILINNPTEVEVPASGYELFSFFAPKSGTFIIYTDYYQGASSNGSSDTVLTLYGDFLRDGTLHNQLAYNDDANGTLFSEIRFNMIESESSDYGTYYIKVAGYSSKSVLAQIRIVEIPTSFVNVNEKTPIDISLKMYEGGFYKFTPLVSGKYRMFTGPYGGGSEINDTIISLYEDVWLTIPIDENDEDIEVRNAFFSALTLNLAAGKTYYIVLKGFESPFHARFSIINKGIVTNKYTYTYDTAGRLLTMKYNQDGYKFEVEYRYDNNGNVIKKNETKTKITN